MKAKNGNTNYKKGLFVCLFVCLCGPQKLQIDIVTPSDGLSLIRDSTSSPRTILLNFFMTLMLLGHGMGGKEWVKEGKKWNSYPKNPTPEMADPVQYLT